MDLPKAGIPAAYDKFALLSAAIRSRYLKDMMDRSVALYYHRRLPDRIRNYLNDERGISDEVIHSSLLGWNGQRITIPIFDRERNLVFFKLAKDPNEKCDSPERLVDPVGSPAELYGWDRVLARPGRIIICDGEFDRLVLESHGFVALTSTAGIAFKPEWANEIEKISSVYVCMGNNPFARKGAELVASLIPQARVVTLPEEVGESGNVTDFFVRLGHSNEDFERLLSETR